MKFCECGGILVKNQTSGKFVCVACKKESSLKDIDASFDYTIVDGKVKRTSQEQKD